MGVFIKRVLDVPFDDVLSSLGPCLRAEGYRLMSDVKAQSESRARNGDYLLRFIVFVNRLNNILNRPDRPIGDPYLRVASYFTMKETTDGGTEITGFDPTLPLTVTNENLDDGSRRARYLRSKIDETLKAIEQVS